MAALAGFLKLVSFAVLEVLSAAVFGAVSDTEGARVVSRVPCSASVVCG